MPSTLRLTVKGKETKHNVQSTAGNEGEGRASILADLGDAKDDDTKANEQKEAYGRRFDERVLRVC